MRAPLQPPSFARSPTRRPKRASPPKMEVKTGKERARPRRPVPCLTFAFSRKLLPEEQRPQANLRQPAPGKACALPSRPSPSPRAPSSPPQPRTPATGSAPARHPQKGAARALGPWQPSPALHLQPLFLRWSCSTRRGEASGTRRGCRCPSSAACHRWRLQLGPAEPLHGGSPEHAGRGSGRGRSSGAGAGTSRLDVPGDAPGHESPCLEGKRFPSETPNSGGLREKIMNEHFINTHVIGRRKQTVIHPARIQSARHAINKKPSEALSDLWAALGKHAVARRGAWGPSAAFEAGGGDGRAPAPRPQPHNVPLFDAGRV